MLPNSPESSVEDKKEEADRHALRAKNGFHDLGLEETMRLARGKKRSLKGLEHRYTSPCRLDPGERLRLSIDSVYPRLGLLSFVRSL